MTISIDPEQAFWWVAGVGLLVAVGCVAADTALNAVRTVAALTRRGGRPAGDTGKGNG